MSDGLKLKDTFTTNLVDIPIAVLLGLIVEFIDSVIILYQNIKH